MFSRLVPFILVALLVMPVAAQRKPNTTQNFSDTTVFTSAEQYKRAGYELLKQVYESTPYSKGMTKEEFMAFKEEIWQQVKEYRRLAREMEKRAREKQLGLIYDNDGRELTGKRGQEKDPNYVTAEVDFSGEFATVDLNKYKGRSQKDITPTSKEYIKVLGITPILDDTTKTPASYGWWINQTLDRLTIKSSNANDSSKVRVWMLVQ